MASKARGATLGGETAEKGAEKVVEDASSWARSAKMCSGSAVGLLEHSVKNREKEEEEEEEER